MWFVSHTPYKPSSTHDSDNMNKHYGLEKKNLSKIYGFTRIGVHAFFGPCPHMDCCIGPKFCNFYLMKIGFTLSELVYLMKMFKLLKLK